VKIDYREIRLWVMNDEGIFNWWKSTRQPISTFIKENNKELRAIIRKVIG
jgi:hypothetical protein